jgi:hypothetical protein
MPECIACAASPTLPTAGQLRCRRRRCPRAPPAHPHPSPGPAAARLAVTHNEVEALHELYHKLSNELHKDDLIHKDEFMWALFKANRDNLFAERVGGWVAELAAAAVGIAWDGPAGGLCRYVGENDQARRAAAPRLQPRLFPRLLELVPLDCQQTASLLHPAAAAACPCCPPCRCLSCLTSSRIM